jgi:hypothetical protein
LDYGRASGIHGKNSHQQRLQVEAKEHTGQAGQVNRESCDGFFVLRQEFAE